MLWYSVEIWLRRERVAQDRHWGRPDFETIQHGFSNNEQFGNIEGSNARVETRRRNGSGLGFDVGSKWGVLLVKESEKKMEMSRS